MVRSQPATLWVDAVSNGPDDSTETLTSLARLGSGVVVPCVERFGGRIIPTNEGAAAMFADADTAVEAALAIAAQAAGADPALRMAIDTTGGTVVGLDLLEHADPGAVVITANGASAGGIAAGTPVDNGEAVQVTTVKPGTVRSGRRPTWRRTLTLGPLGGVAFAPVAARLVMPSRDDTAEQATPTLEEIPLEPKPSAAADPQPDAAVIEDEPAAIIAGIKVFADSTDRQAFAEAAISIFEEAGLDLPDGLLLYFHDAGDYEQCGGHAAVATHADDWERIDMCTESEFTIYHEMAHIWAEDHLSEEQRNAFLDNRDLDTWRDLGEEGADLPEYLAHRLRGSEHAADVIAWGLTGRFPQMIPDNDMKSMREAYTLLTGDETPPFLAAKASAAEADPLGISSLPVTAPQPDDTAADPAVDTPRPFDPADGDPVYELSEEADAVIEPVALIDEDHGDMVETDLEDLEPDEPDVEDDPFDAAEHLT